MDLDVNVVVVVFVGIFVIISTIAVILSIRFQKKQKEKYKNLQEIIKEKNGLTFTINDEISKEEIHKVDKDVDVDLLMRELYDTYILFEEKIKNLDTDFSDVLTPDFSEFYTNVINNYKAIDYKEQKHNIELLGYGITEYNKIMLRFRINISCFNYKIRNNKIIGESNVRKVEQIMIVTYENIGDKWLICNYDKIYEKNC